MSIGGRKASTDHRLGQEPLRFLVALAHAVVRQSVSHPFFPDVFVGAGEQDGVLDLVSRQCSKEVVESILSHRVVYGKHRLRNRLTRPLKPLSGRQQRRHYHRLRISDEAEGAVRSARGRPALPLSISLSQLLRIPGQRKVLRLTHQSALIEKPLTGTQLALTTPLKDLSLRRSKPASLIRYRTRDPR